MTWGEFLARVEVMLSQVERDRVTDRAEVERLERGFRSLAAELDKILYGEHPEWR